MMLTAVFSLFLTGVCLFWMDHPGKTRDSTSWMENELEIRKFPAGTGFLQVQDCSCFVNINSPLTEERRKQSVIMRKNM